jgi:hypothetical protein
MRYPTRAYQSDTTVASSNATATARPAKNESLLTNMPTYQVLNFPRHLRRALLPCVSGVPASHSRRKTRRPRRTRLPGLS